VLLNEPSDNVGSGAAGDSSNILRCLIGRNIAVPTILTICDPDAVQVCMSRSVGERVTIHVGGVFNTDDPGCDVSGTLRLVHDGSYRFRGPVQTGVRTSVGTSVVLEFNEDMFLQVTSIPPYTIDPEHYRCMGLHPERMKLVGIKSQGSYKASYDNLPHEMLLVDSPGFSSSNMERIPYTKVDKDAVYPFNEHAVFNPAAAVSSSL
jgi:microcystin degradation protein MlrC